MEQDDNLKDQLKPSEIPDNGAIGPDESDKVIEPSEAAEPISFPDQIEEKKERSIFKSILIFVSFFFLILLLSSAFILYIVPVIQEAGLHEKRKSGKSQNLNNDADYKKELNILKRDHQTFLRKYSSYTSWEPYIVINTTENRFLLYKNKKLILESLCSSGANKILQAGKKTFVFKTPKGQFVVNGKRKYPYWHRSDWDFIEQGLPVPSADDPSRWEAGTLGDYALDLVDGYMIHGTIYKRLMGMPVTHGCIRLGDKDLEMVYNTLNVGSKVYIF
jgi:lipoprotein-anchoring transpeptidase ErfK/SrfK